MSLSNATFNVISSGPSGMCVSIGNAGPAFFCGREIRTLNPIYLPPNSTLTTLYNSDRQLASNFATRSPSNCSDSQRIMDCGMNFAPCAETNPPTQSGLCKSICIQASKCFGFYVPRNCQSYYSKFEGEIVQCDTPIPNPYCESNQYIVDDITNTSATCGGKVDYIPFNSDASSFARYTVYGTLVLPLLANLVAVLLCFDARI